MAALLLNLFIHSDHQNRYHNGYLIMMVMIVMMMMIVILIVMRRVEIRHDVVHTSSKSNDGKTITQPDENYAGWGGMVMLIQGI